MCSPKTLGICFGRGPLEHFHHDVWLHSSGFKFIQACLSLEPYVKWWPKLMDMLHSWFQLKPPVLCLPYATFRRSLQRWRSPSRFPSDVSSRPSLAVQMWRKCPGRMMACSLLAVGVLVLWKKGRCFTLFYIAYIPFIMYNHYPWGYVQVMQSLWVMFFCFSFFNCHFFPPRFNKKSTDVPRQEVLIHGSEV